MGNKSIKKRQDATPAEKSKDMVDHIVNKATEKEEQAKRKAESEALAKQAEEQKIKVEKLLEALAPLPKVSQNDVDWAMIVKGNQRSENALLPLQSVSIQGKLSGMFATIDIDLVYVNPSKDHALEATYQFPLQPKTLLASLEAELNGKTIVAKVQDKEKARETYDDAVSAGKATVLAERNTNSPTSGEMQIKLGNLNPEATMKLKLKLVMELEIKFGSYQFCVPMAFFPDYSKHGVAADAFPYDFKYSLTVESTNKLQSIVLPEKATLASQSDDGLQAVVEGSERVKNVVLFWRTSEMLKPHLLLAKDEEKQEVAVSASLVPTFEPPNPQDDELEVLENEEPEVTDWSGDDKHYIFLVDQSGSMGGPRIKKAKEALKIFIRSLPADCRFSICSFGTRFTWMKSLIGNDVIPYDEDHQEVVLNRIAKFDADHGGTDILTPIRQAQNLNSWLEGDEEGSTVEKRIFVLTDGQCGSKNAIFQQCRDNVEMAQVYTFGLGSGCDTHLCREMASAGQGTCSIIPDHSPDLTEIVIKALTSSLTPSLRRCAIKWQHQASQENIGNIQRDQSIVSSQIIPMSELENLAFTFTCKREPVQGLPLNLTFTQHDFKEVTGDEAKSLFQYAALSKINNEYNTQMKVELSLKYQVLCDETAMIGVIKQEQTSAETKEVNVNLNEDQFAQERLEAEIAKKYEEEQARRRAEAQKRMQEEQELYGSMQKKSYGMAMMSAAPDLDMMMERGAMLEDSSMNFRSSAKRGLKKKESRAAPQKRAMLRSESPEELCAANDMLMDYNAAPQLDDLCENFASAAPMQMKQAAFLENDLDDDDSCESLEEMEKERSAPIMKSSAALNLEKADALDDLMDIDKGAALASAPAIDEEAKIAQPVKQANTAIPKATKAKKGKNEIDAQALQKVVAKTTSKPSFDAVIGHQSTKGYWGANTQPAFAGCYKDGQTEDAKVKQELVALGDAINQGDIDTLYTTLLAIHTLTVAYQSQQGQWTLLVKKAKAFLKAVGVAKVDKILKLFTLTQA